MKNLLALAVLASSMVLPALAQLDTGIIEGTVRDASGAAIPNAAITITEIQTNIVYNVVSSGQGNYVSPPLKVGSYSVSATAPGFKTYTRSGITLQVQDRLAVDAKLRSWSEDRADRRHRRSGADSIGDLLAGTGHYRAAGC